MNISDPQGLESIRAKQVMRTDVSTVSATATIDSLLELLQEKNLAGVPVVDEQEKVVGVVSQIDFVVLKNETAFSESEMLPDFYTAVQIDHLEVSDGSLEALNSPGSHTVGDIMAREIVAVPEEAYLGDVAVKMITESVHRVLVLDPQGKLRGLIHDMDLIRILARSLKSRYASGTC
jgi:CBS domain-containing membrane protein